MNFIREGSMRSNMRWIRLVGLVFGVLLNGSALAYAQYGIQQPTPLPGPACLTDAQRQVNVGLKALARSTTKDDPVWIFDPDYFVGTWRLEWNGPETPLGSDVTGTLAIVHVEGCDYEGTLQAKSGTGPFRAKIQISSDPVRQWLTWVETDSRGFTQVRSGLIGGDLGGFFTHFWERSPVFTLKGKKIRLAGSTFFPSPGSFQLRAQISVDGGPYASMGILWFRKEPGSAPGASR